MYATHATVLPFNYQMSTKSNFAAGPSSFYLPLLKLTPQGFEI